MAQKKAKEKNWLLWAGGVLFLVLVISTLFFKEAKDYLKVLSDLLRDMSDLKSELDPILRAILQFGAWGSVISILTVLGILITAIFTASSARAAREGARATALAAEATAFVESTHFLDEPHVFEARHDLYKFRNDSRWNNFNYWPQDIVRKAEIVANRFDAVAAMTENEMLKEDQIKKVWGEAMIQSGKVLRPMLQYCGQYWKSYQSLLERL